MLFAALACAALATSLRLHLTFTARVYPGDLAAQRAWARPWTRGCDVGLAALLLLAALAIGAAHQAWATLLVTMAIVTLVASLVIEPATTRAAFTQKVGHHAGPEESRLMAGGAQPRDIGTSAHGVTDAWTDGHSWVRRAPRPRRG